MTDSSDSFDEKLKAAYLRFKAATDPNARDQEEWDATRAFMKVLLEWRANGNYATFTRKLRTLLGVSTNQPDTYLKAARFASVELPTTPKHQIRIIDLPKHVRCPNITQMAKAYSLMTSKNVQKQTYGRECLVRASRGEELESEKKMAQACNDRRFSYSLTGLSAAPEDAVRCFCEFLSSLIALGDKQAADCLQKIRAAVAAGGAIEIALNGMFKGKLAPNPDLARDFGSDYFIADEDTVTLTSPDEAAAIRSWIVQDPTTPSNRGKRNAKPRTVEQQVLLDRNERMRNRDKRIALFTYDSAGPIFTGQETLASILNGLMPGWEDPSPPKFEFAMGTANDPSTSVAMFDKMQRALKKSVQEMRTGVLMIAFPPTTPDVHEKARKDFQAQSGTVDEMIRAASKYWMMSGQPVLHYADVVAADPAEANRRLGEVLKIQKKLFKDMRLGILVFPREPRGDVELRLQYEAARTRAIEISEAESQPIDLKSFTQDFFDEHDLVTYELAEKSVTAAYAYLRKKIQGEPTAAELSAKAWSIAHAALVESCEFSPIHRLQEFEDWCKFQRLKSTVP